MFNQQLIQCRNKDDIDNLLGPGFELVQDKLWQTGSPLLYNGVPTVITILVIVRIFKRTNQWCGQGVLNVDPFH